MKFDQDTLMAMPAIRNAIAAEEQRAENDARIRENARREAQAAKFRTAPSGMKLPATGTNPWLDASWNMSQQSYLMNKDPQAAARLRAEAGLADIMAPSREDARRVQQSGGFIAQRVAAAVKSEQSETPAPVPPATPKPITTTASETAMDLARAALKQIGATVTERQFFALAEALDRARPDAEGRIEMYDDAGQLLVDLRGTAEAGRIVGYSPEAYLRIVHGIQPDAPVEEPAKTETPAPAAEFKPMHVRVQEAYAAGPEAVAALMAEVSQRAQA